jgi:PAS domain S-box-containing protein
MDELPIECDSRPRLRSTMWPMWPRHVEGRSPAYQGLLDFSRRRGRAMIALIAATGSVVLAMAVVQLLRVPIAPPFLLLLACTVVSGWATLRMRYVPISFSVSDTFTIAATLLYGTAAGTVLAAIDALVMSLRITRSRTDAMWFRLLFNIASTALAMAIAGGTFYLLRDGRPLEHDSATLGNTLVPLALFAALYFLLNTGFVAVAVAQERGEAIVAVWKTHLSALWLAYFSGASIASVLVLLNVRNVIDLRAALVLLPLVAILYVAYRAGLDRAIERIEHHHEVSIYAEGLRSTGEGVLMIDCDGMITFANPAAERLLRVARADVVGRPAGEIYRLRSVQRPGSPRFQPMPTGEAREGILVVGGGAGVPIEERQTSIRDADGTPLGTIVSFHDISARKASESEREALFEAERQARERADGVNRLKDEFLTTISHELRTPATGVLGWARLLRTGRLDPEQTRQALDALERGAQAQARLLDDLLDMSRIIRGTLRIELAPVDIRDVLAGAIETVTPAMHAKRILFANAVPPDLPAVQADPDRLRQVFWNLLSNAVKFTEPGGSIAVSGRAEADQVVVTVRDSGHGISSEALPYIFDRFRQADGSSTRPHGGLGLGLAIVRHLIELHGGTVTASSEGRGRGAEFEIGLPIARGVQPRPATVSDAVS